MQELREKIFYYDEDNARSRQFTERFGQRFEILHAGSFAPAYSILRAGEVKAAVVNDDESGVGHALLSLVANDMPLVGRFLVSSAGDVDTMVKAVNEARVTKIFRLPLQDDEFTSSISAAINGYNMKVVEASNAEHARVLASLQELRINSLAREIDQGRKTGTLAVPASEQCFELLVQNSRDFIAMFDAAGNMVYSNTIFNELAGRDFLGADGNPANVNDKIFFNQKVREALKRNLDLEFHTTWEVNARALRVDWSLNVERDNTGKARVILAVGKDITKMHVTLEELDSARNKAVESDKLKDAFLTNISHEIRTPVHNILGFVDVLTTEQLDQAEREQYSSIVKKNCSQLLRILNDIVDISKIEAGVADVEMQECEVNSMMLDILAHYLDAARERGLALELSTAREGMFILSTDEGKLRQVLTNLVDNALKYTSQGSIHFGYKIFEAVAVFFVSDTGIGIPPENHDIIFHYFRQADSSYSRNYEGTGLGLAISKAFVELIGGRMWLESEPREGSTFFFSIPINS